MTSDTHEPTAWEEINPQTALARQRGPQLPCSAHLRPASSDQFRNELTACLALVVPSGMTEEARREWLAVAWGTLKHLPGDLLARGCKAAREKCDHPAKIVPTILAEVESVLEHRRRMDREHDELVCLPSPTKRHVMDRRGQPMSEEDTAELNALLETLGAKARYRPDGSRYIVSN